MSYFRFLAFPFLILLCGVMFGCASSTATLTSDPHEAEQILRASMRDTAYITLTKGSVEKGFSVTIRQYSCEWLSATDRIQKEVPIAQVQSIRVWTPQVSPIVVLSGIAVGAGSGALIVSGVSRPIGAVAGGLIGGIIGEFLGAKIGKDKETTYFRQDSASIQAVR
jgi:hypothetical protein